MRKILKIKNGKSKNSIAYFLEYSFIIVLVFLVIVFILLPFLAVFKRAFFYNGKFSLSLFEYVFKNKLYLLKNSAITGICTSLLTSLAAVSVSLFFYLSPKKIKSILFFILSITMISPPFVTALTYINLFGRRGLISYYILGISKSPYGMIGIVLMQSLSNFSLAALIIIGFLNQLNTLQIDSARSFGAGTSKIITDIIIPHIFPAIKASALLVFLRSISDFGTPAIIGGSFDVLATESYFAVIAEGDLGKAAAINILMFLPALFVFVFYQRSIKNLTYVSHGTDSSEIELKRSGIVYYGIACIAILFLLWISIQYVSIILSSVTGMKKGKLIFTLANIAESYEHINGTIIRTIVYSLISGVAGSLLGILIAYYNQLRKIKIMRIVDFIATTPYIIPGTFFGLGYLLSFSSKPFMLTGTAAIVIVNVIFKQLPFSTKIGNAGMENINIDILNSIRDLGGGRMNEIVDAVIPLNKHTIGVSFINGFTTTMTTIGSIIFLVYPGQKVLTLVMFDVIQSGNYEVGSVIALLIIIICVSINLAYSFILKRK